MEKVNIAELIKDCPKGMKLYCAMYEDVYFDYVDELNIIHCYIQYETHKTSITFNQHGTPNSNIKSKCVIFPKGKTTWEGFQRPFRDGDVVYICDEYSDATFTYVAILKHVEKGGRVYPHCFYNYEDDEFCTNSFLYDIYSVRFATEEEKAKLFKAIKENGYKWNAETKTLEKLIQPKFKVGDRIRHKKNGNILKIVEIDISDSAYCCGLDYIWVDDQDNYELVPNKFDITTLKPFESKVLVRDNKLQKWSPAIWGFYDPDSKDYKYKLVGVIARYCIPYKGNEHLIGKTDDCDEYFKTWKL